MAEPASKCRAAMIVADGFVSACWAEAKRFNDLKV
jgi:hypothetical protein